MPWHTRYRVVSLHLTVVPITRRVVVPVPFGATRFWLHDNPSQPYLGQSLEAIYNNQRSLTVTRQVNGQWSMVKSIVMHRLPLPLHTPSSDSCFAALAVGDLHH